MNARLAAAGGALLVGLAVAWYWREAPAPRVGGPEAVVESVAPSVEAPESLPSPAAAASEIGPAPARPLAPSAVVVAPTPEVPFDEAGLMTRLRASAKSDPEGTIALAREGNLRFPDSADTPERTSILIHALATVDRASEARGEAEDMVNRYPDSSWVREIESFTGAHRHRSIRLTEAGTLEYY